MQLTIVTSSKTHFDYKFTPRIWGHLSFLILMIIECLSHYDTGTVNLRFLVGIIALPFAASACCKISTSDYWLLAFVSAAIVSFLTVTIFTNQTGDCLTAGVICLLACLEISRHRSLSLNKWYQAGAWVAVKSTRVVAYTVAGLLVLLSVNDTGALLSALIALPVALAFGFFMPIRGGSELYVSQDCRIEMRDVEHTADGQFDEIGFRIKNFNERRHFIVEQVTSFNYEGNKTIRFNTLAGVNGEQGLRAFRNGTLVLFASADQALGEASTSYRENGKLHTA